MSDEDKTSKFENYSELCPSIIELYVKNYCSVNLFEQIDTIIQNANIIIQQDNEVFSFKDKYKNENTSITMKDLIHLKNKIDIIQNIQNEEKSNDKIQSEYKKLIFFKEIITNLEVINEYMEILSLPILIKIIIAYPEIKYFLQEKETKFEEIKNILFKAKIDYITLLDSFYKDNANIWFLFGKQFRSIIKHLNCNYNIDSFLRYILNKIDNKESIKEGYVVNINNCDDYIKRYKLYNRNYLDIISNYITFLFENNETTLEKHYKKMLIKNNENEKKGIYFQKCDCKSMYFLF